MSLVTHSTPNADNRSEQKGASKPSGFQGLGSSLRMVFRRLSSSGDREKAVVHAEERGTRAAMPSMGMCEEAITSAGLSSLTGRRLARIGLLYDINLSSRLVSRESGLEEQRVRDGVLEAARNLRREFNRVSRQQPRFLDCAGVEKLINSFQERCRGVGATGRLFGSLHDACHEVRDSLRLARRGFMPWQKAREGVARILGEAREIVGDPKITELTRSAGAMSCEVRRDISDGLNFLATITNQFSNSLEEGLRLMDPRPMLVSLKRVLGEDLGRSLEYGQSAPTDIAIASRRSLCGNKLGALAVLESRVEAFAKNPSKKTLSPVVEALKSWRRGENPNEEGPLVGSLEKLERSPLTVPHTSKQAMFRDALLPALQWGLENLDNLSSESRRDIVLLLRSCVVGLHALTVREMAETFDVLLYPRTSDLLGQFCKSTLVSRFVGVGRLGGLVGTLLSGERDSPAERLSNGKTLQEVIAGFRKAGSKSPTEERGDLSSLVQWAARRAQAHARAVPELPCEEALWLSEYDGGQGACLPTELQRRFVEMQRAVQVPAASTQGGFVFPETEEWLQDHVANHDGMVIVVTEGDPRKPFCDQEPDTILVGTCSQNKPSPLMKKIEEEAAGFIATLPLSSEGTLNPRVVAELAVSNRQAALAVRSFGEHPFRAAFCQFVFNVSSRFPEAERVECFATCREGSLAMNAHERQGWRKTGCVYTDEHGTRFDIIHVAIHPVDILRGVGDF